MTAQANTALAAAAPQADPAVISRDSRPLRLINNGMDLLFWSERDGWGHWYLYDGAGKLLALFTVTTGSSHDPLPLGEWGVNGVSRNPPFAYDPDLFWDVPDHEEEHRLPPGPNGPVGVVWIDLTREHYGIHGTPNPETIGRAQSHGCVRLTNWDAARLAGMVDGSTRVVFDA